MSRLNRHSSSAEEVYDRYADLLYRIALAQTGSDADAQDVLQDVFVQYITKTPLFFSDEHEKAWLIRVTVNRCHDLHRYHSSHPTVSLDEALGVATEDGDAVREILQTVSQLPNKYKDTIVLHCLNGFTLQETAEILHISLSAAKMRLARGREMLQDLKK